MNYILKYKNKYLPKIKITTAYWKEPPNLTIDSIRQPREVSK